MRDPSVIELIRKTQLAALVAAMRAAEIHPDALIEAYTKAMESDSTERSPRPTRPGEPGDDPTNMGYGTTAFIHLCTAAGFASPDVSEMALLVMMATKDMDDDIREIMAEIKSMTAAKKRLRLLLSDLNRWISQQMAEHRSSENLDNEKVFGTSPGGLFHASDHEITYNEPRPDVESSDLVADNETVYSLGGGEVTIKGLTSLLDDLKGKLDGMNEMSEMTSLRLQMTMDRRSKSISTLSNMMKKISTTQDSLVQNIK